MPVSKESSVVDGTTRISAPTVSLPKGGGAIKGIGEKFTANPVTGTGSMSVPLATSPGRSGFGPQLTLSYDSGSGNGPFGFGWGLALPAITRKTDQGLPQYRDGEESDVYILSGAEDLVPVLRPDGTRFEDATTFPGYVIHRYRPRVEGGFARIERWTEVATGEIHWRSLTRDNVTTWYGKDANSRIANSADPAPKPSRIFSWLICESDDDKGNAIVYRYAAEDDRNVDRGQANERNRVRTANRYLKRVEYGNRVSRLIQPDLTQAPWMFEVVFDYDEGLYEEVPLDPGRPESEQHRFVRAAPSSPGGWKVRPDPFSSHRAGFEVRTYRRCRRILMFHHIPDLPTGEKGYDGLVRSTEFDYVDLDYRQPVTIEDELAHQGSTRFASFIRAVTQSGYLRDETQPVVVHDGIPYPTYLKKSLPPLEFEYSKAVIHDAVQELDSGSIENLPTGLDESTYQWVDLDGEGVSGILTEQAGAWFYKSNLGGGRFGRLATVSRKPSPVGTGSAHPQLLDLAGDGQLDLVAFAGPTPGFYERTHEEGWEPFQAFRQVAAVPWEDPNLRFVDLNGDGHADVLITEQDVFTWHPSLAEEGFGPAHRVRQPLDEERGPKLVLADGTQSVYLADMCGDGLADLVRVRNGEVCYWPNHGYGRFGPKVTLDNSPRFDHPDQFEQSRVRLADIDGSGTSDIIYLGRDGVRLYFNESGNRLSDARRLAQFPRVDDASSVLTADLLGSGTACLVWSSLLPGPTHRPLRYIDLMGGTKPHLLIKSVNNLGAETEVQYVPATRFYLADKGAGRPWVSRLPFPVHVVEQVITHDRISNNRFVTSYTYHHGYFDGVEREFRGFGLVEQLDTEEFAALAGGPAATATNIAASSHVPPVLTKTWFHTGVYLGRGHVSDFFAGLIDANDVGEYYREPGLADTEARALLLEDTVLPENLTLEEEREARRALKGSMLRQEVYGLDGSQRQEHPYTVIEQNFAIRMLQPRRGKRYGVFLPHARESISYHYERASTDPRIGHALTLEVDDFGNALQTASVAYGRRQPDTSLSPADQAKQSQVYITYTENRFTDDVATADNRRAPLLCESRSYELTGLALPSGHTRFTLDEILHAGQTAAVIEYQVTRTPGVLQKRLLEHIRTYYRRDSLAGSLPLGELQPLALPFETYKLAFTPGLITKVYGARMMDAMLEDESGYVHTEGDANWWVPSGRIFYSPDPNDTAAEELAYAREHFFLPHRYRDPFHTDTVRTERFLTYDRYDFLLQETRDPLENRVTVGERQLDPTQPPIRLRQDYRVLQPAMVMDPNRNRSEVAFDALGMVVGTAVMGKPEDAPAPGDRIPATFRADLTQAEIDAFLAHPTGPMASALLEESSTRIVYDLLAYWREPNATKRLPAVAATLVRETHASEPVPAEGLRIHVSISYSDGFGRAIQKKVQAEPGPVPQRDAVGKIIVGPDGQPQMTPNAVSPRWVGSSWTVFNNKGRPVRQYEPFFTDTHRFEFDVRIGVSPVLFYDPVERVVGTLHPDHTWEKVVFDPWRQESWDPSDTVLVADPRTDADLGDFFTRLADADEYLPTWYALRTDPAHTAVAHQRWPDPKTRDAETSAAVKAALHAATPSLTHADTLGRSFLITLHNRLKYSDTPAADPPAEEFPRTRLSLDIEGNQRELVDANDRVLMRYDYDMLGNRIHQASMEAGERWILKDPVGSPLYTWDSRGHRIHTAYDPLRRPTDTSLREGQGAERVVERSSYGEHFPNPEAANLRGQIAELRDQAGIVTSDEYDFKGNPLRTRRALAQSYNTILDWSGPVALENAPYISRTRYDALNRPIQVIPPHRDQSGTVVTVIQPSYTEADLLGRVDAWLDQSAEPPAPLDPATADLHVISHIEYDAKGQRQRVDYGNGATTVYQYEPFTFRLTHLLTRRNPADFPGDCPDPAPAGFPGCEVQSLRYTYDPTGNMTHVRDDAQQTIYFTNQRVEPSTEYTYDATYRLIEAMGREHLGQVGGQPIPHSYNDAPRVVQPHPSDGKAMGRYLERYRYNLVGSLLTMQHRGSAPTHPGWTRTYSYDEESQLEAGKQSNRLTSTIIGGSTETYSVGGTGYDAHGNMLRMPQLQAMQWDFKDQLQMTQRQAVSPEDAEGARHQGERTWYAYDHAGQRVRTVTELGAQMKEERIYLGDCEIYRRTGANLLVRETLHVTDGDQPVAMVESRRQGTEPGVPRQLIRYQLGNHLGSACLELDHAAQVISYEEYTPYGSTSYQAVRSQTEAPKRYRHSGKERDEASGLYYYGARFYAPWLARWTSTDPGPQRLATDLGTRSEPEDAGEAEAAEQEPERTRSPRIDVTLLINLYLFNRDNPLRFHDPDGQHPIEKAGRKAAQKLGGRFFREWGTKQGTRLVKKGADIAAKRLAKHGIVPDVAKHIADHFKEIPGKVVNSIFTKEYRKTEKIAGLIEETLTKAGRSPLLSRADNGALVWVFEKDFGKAIGKKGDEALSKLRVVVDMEGRLVTAFPVDNFLESVAVRGLRVSAKLATALVLLETVYEGEAEAATETKRKFDERNEETAWWEWVLPWDVSRLGYEPNFHTIRDRADKAVEKIEKETGVGLSAEEKQQIRKDVEQIWLSVQ
jgi:RHS repeat-associated protein